MKILAKSFVSEISNVLLFPFLSLKKDYCSVPQTPAHTTPTPDPHLWGQVLKKRPLIMGLGLFWEIWNNQISEPKKTTTPKQNNLFLFCFYDNTVKTNVKKRCFDFCHLKKFYTESFQLQPNLPNNTHGCCKDQPAITFHPLCHGENPESFLKKNTTTTEWTCSGINSPGLWGSSHTTASQLIQQFWFSRPFLRLK